MRAHPTLHLVPSDDTRLHVVVRQDDLERPYALLWVLLVAYPFLLLVAGLALCVWAGWVGR